MARLIDYSDPARHTGRTTNLALKFVRQALEYPGKPVYPRDHYESTQAHMRLLGLVAEVLDVLGVEFRISTASLSITVVPLEKSPWPSIK